MKPHPTQMSRVRQLRRGGLSFNQIAKRLHIKKNGTMSTWTQDISLTDKQVRKLRDRMRNGGLKGGKRVQKKYKVARQYETARLQQEAIREIGILTKRELFILGVGMYWSEGYTYAGGEQVGFTNSDPKLVLLILKWFQQTCKISKERITLHVKINKAHKNRGSEIERYWSRVTGIPLSQFTKTTIIKTWPRKIYPQSKTYMGTLRITIKQGTSLRRKIHGWIEGLIRNT